MEPPLWAQKNHNFYRELTQRAKSKKNLPFSKEQVQRKRAVSHILNLKV